MRETGRKEGRKEGRERERSYSRVDLVTGPVLEHTVELKKMAPIFTLINIIYLNMDKLILKIFQMSLPAGEQAVL